MITQTNMIRNLVFLQSIAFLAGCAATAPGGSPANVTQVQKPVTASEGEENSSVGERSDPAPKEPIIAPAIHTAESASGLPYVKQTGTVHELGEFQPPVIKPQPPARSVGAENTSMASHSQITSQVTWKSQSAPTQPKAQGDAFKSNDCLPPIAIPTTTPASSSIDGTSNEPQSRSKDCDELRELVEQLRQEQAAQKRGFEAKLGELQRQIAQQQEVHANLNTKIENLTQAKLQAQARFEQLQLTVEHDRRELVRLETLIEQQHSNDLAILDELSQQLQSVIDIVPVSARRSVGSTQHTNASEGLEKTGQSR